MSGVGTPWPHPPAKAAPPAAKAGPPDNTLGKGNPSKSSSGDKKGVGKGKAGKGGGYVQVTMRDIKNNNTVTHKFSSDERVDTVEVDKPTMYTLLYREDDVVHLMEEETFEQIEMPIALLDKEQQRWLHDGMAVKVNKYEGQPLFVTPASRATFTVAESPPAKSGENLKAAVLDNGEKIRVPTYVEVGQRVVVNTTDGTFSARADD